MTVRINFVSSHIAMFLLVPPLLLIGRFISDRRKTFSNSYSNTTPLRPHAMFVAKSEEIFRNTQNTFLLAYILQQSSYNYISLNMRKKR